MDILTAAMIALGLSMDTLALSITSGASILSFRFHHPFRIAGVFAVVQGAMPLLGWLIGSKLQGPIGRYDHWAAFGILGFIGGKMIVESYRRKSDDPAECAARKCDPLKWSYLLPVALATSIDALAVGVSLAILNTAILMPVVVIGAVTFLVSFSGVLIGRRFCHFFENKIERIGGLCLIGIGVKILIEHG
jgi:putative Mn2+ efflux pump MntP